MNEVCEACEGSGREMMNYGNGDVRDESCSMCKGEGTKAAYELATAGIESYIQSSGNTGCMCLECAIAKGYDV